MKEEASINYSEGIENNDTEDLKKADISDKNEDKLLNLIAEIIINIVMEDDE